MVATLIQGISKTFLGALSLVEFPPKTVISPPTFDPLLTFEKVFFDCSERQKSHVLDFTKLWTYLGSVEALFYDLKDHF